MVKKIFSENLLTYSGVCAMMKPQNEPTHDRPTGRTEENEMTNKELGNAIRATLKKEGYAPRDFSVRVRDCGYSTSAHVTI